MNVFFFKQKVSGDFLQTKIIFIRKSNSSSSERDLKKSSSSHKVLEMLFHCNVFLNNAIDLITQDSHPAVLK